MLSKSIFEKLTRTGLVAIVVDTPVESPAKKVQDVRENLNEARENLIKAREAVAQALLDSVQNFKNESYERNIKNGRIIAEFRNMIPSAKNELISKYYTRIDELELKNYEIKNKIEAYIFEGKCKWISFKNEYRHDMCSLEKSIKDFSIESET